MIAYDECKLALDKVYKEKDDLTFALDNLTCINDTYIEENKGLNYLYTYYNSENKKLKSSGKFWKIFAVIAPIGTFYLGTRLCKTK